MAAEAPPPAAGRAAAGGPGKGSVAVGALPLVAGGLEAAGWVPGSAICGCLFSITLNIFALRKLF